MTLSRGIIACALSVYVVLELIGPTHAALIARIRFHAGFHS